jgi:hypothetical protein
MEREDHSKDPLSLLRPNVTLRRWAGRFKCLTKAAKFACGFSLERCQVRVGRLTICEAVE